MKAVTRREFLLDTLNKDTLKSIFGAYHEFNEARVKAGQIASCDEAGLRLGKKSKKYLDKFFQNKRKEG